MHLEYIKYRIRRAGTTGAAIAAELGVDRSAVSSTISGKIRSQRIEQAVADAIGEPVHLVFPDRYPVDEASFAS